MKFLLSFTISTNPRISSHKVFAANLLLMLARFRIIWVKELPTPRGLNPQSPSKRLNSILRRTVRLSFRLVELITIWRRIAYLKQKISTLKKRSKRSKDIKRIEPSLRTTLRPSLKRWLNSLSRVRRFPQILSKHPKFLSMCLTFSELQPRNLIMRTSISRMTTNLTNLRKLKSWRRRSPRTVNRQSTPQSRLTDCHHQRVHQISK